MIAFAPPGPVAAPWAVSRVLLATGGGTVFDAAGGTLRPKPAGLVFADGWSTDNPSGRTWPVSSAAVPAAQPADTPDDETTAWLAASRRALQSWMAENPW